ncbi:MAG TPA: hypothetical protein VF989_03920 [Polyangiaceae bacterium]
MNADPRSAEPSSSRLKQVTIATAGAAVALGAAYGVGRLQASKSIDAAEERTAEAVSSREAETRRRELERSALLELEARRRLSLCLIALDERNFGEAQAHLDAAAALLDKAGAGDQGPLAELKRKAGEFKLIATDNLGPQRQRVLNWMRNFDEARPPAKP